MSEKRMIISNLLGEGGGGRGGAAAAPVSTALINLFGKFAL